MTTDSRLLRVRVAAKQAEAQDICVLDLVSADGRPLPPFGAGAHIDVHVQGMVRQYSLCNAPAETGRYQIAVLRCADSRGGSQAVHDTLSAGDELDISAPRNHFALDDAASHSLLLAGGIGVTPLMAMAEALSAAGASFALHYCTRNPARTAFRKRLAEAPYAGRVALHHDDGSTPPLDLPARLAACPDGTHVYACGPSGFLEHVLATAQAAGWDMGRVHYERFTAPAAAHPCGQGAETGFEVCIASSGERYYIAPDRSVTDALRDHGIDIPVSCEQGVCGTCLTGVLAGEPDHRDAYLTPDEQARNDQFTPCCSRSRSDCLVLDL